MECEPATLAYDPVTARPNVERRDLSCPPRQARPAVAVLATLPGQIELWTPVPDLLDSTAFDTSFVAEVDDDGRAILRFGDSEYGRMVDGATAFTAVYRVGNGRAGNVGQDSLFHVALPGGASASGRIQVVRNPIAAAGGVEPETIEEVRRLAPDAFRAEQFRAVTEADYRSAALKLPEVSGAVAAFRWTGSWYTVFVGVDPTDPADVETGPTGLPRLRPAFERLVRAQLTRYRLAGYDLELRPPRFAPIELDLDVCAASGHFRGDVLRALRDAMGARILPGRRLGSSTRRTSLSVRRSTRAGSMRRWRPSRASIRWSSPDSAATASSTTASSRPAGCRSARGRSPSSTTTRASSSTACCASPCEVARDDPHGARHLRLLRPGGALDTARGREPAAPVRGGLPHRHLRKLPRVDAQRASRATWRSPDLSTREDDDFAITVLDLWAAVADVLTFYQERYANEAFLRTATRRESVRRLADLIGYQLAPGAAAMTWLAFSLENGQAVGLPAGIRVQSVPGQGTRSPEAAPTQAAAPDVAAPVSELPQTFETLEPLSADARLNRLRVFGPPAGPGPLAAGQTEAVLDRLGGPSIAASLHPGDRIALFDDGQVTRVEEKEVRAVRLEDDAAIVAWTQPVAGTTWSTTTSAWRYTRILRLFGHEAPAQAFSLAADPNSLGGVKWTQTTTSYAYPQTAAETSPAVVGTSLLCLDGRVDGIGAGDRLLVADTQDSGQKRQVTVLAVDQTQDSLGGVTTSVTRLRVAPAIVATDRRFVRVHQLTGPGVTFWASRYPTTMGSTTLYLPGRRVVDEAGTGVEVGRHIEQGAFTPGSVIHPGEIVVGRRVILTDAAGRTVLGTVHAATAIEPTSGSPGTFAHLVVSLQTEATPTLDARSAVLLGNVAQGSHGETVRSEVVGNGDASRSFQRFALRKAPLTYVPGEGAVPLASSLEVQVEGIRWHEVPSLYGRGPTERVLVTRTGDDGTTILQFGDGKTGARVPTGQGNVSATYRMGTGLVGRAAAGALTTALDRPRGLRSVTNPLPATGGADPEVIADARENAPRTVRTFGRIVSRRDFTDQVRATGEVAKADARWIWDGLDQADLPDHRRARGRAVRRRATPPDRRQPGRGPGHEHPAADRQLRPRAGEVADDHPDRPRPGCEGRRGGRPRCRRRGALVRCDVPRPVGRPERSLRGHPGGRGRPVGRRGRPDVQAT